MCRYSARLILTLMIASVAMAQAVAASPTLPCGGPSPKAVVDWAQFHFDLCHTGFNPYEFVLSPTTVVNLGPRWHYTTGFEVASSPAVANGVVYIGSDDNNM